MKIRANTKLESVSLQCDKEMVSEIFMVNSHDINNVYLKQHTGLW